MERKFRIVIFGLSVTSSWGNGHATTYRGLMRGLTALGHDVTFFERDLPWYAKNRDLPTLPYGRAQIYTALEEIKASARNRVRDADLVIVGSYVPEGIELGEWVTRVARGATAFYDIDTPVTLAKLERDEADYVSRRLVPRYSLYLSFTGGPTLRRIEREYGAAIARALYCSVDPQLYYPQTSKLKWDLGYMGTYSEDRQPLLEDLLFEPARRCKGLRMVVAGPQYPRATRWPENVKRIVHLAPAKHRGFYGAQKFTMNITRSAMRTAGYSPSVRLFEAAACGTPIITDAWPGLDGFLRPGSEILISGSAEDTLEYLRDIPEAARIAIGIKARARILKEHTAMHRAAELEAYVSEILGRKSAKLQRSMAAESLLGCAPVGQASD
jgi:spore maturation protein CgeB